MFKFFGAPLVPPGEYVLAYVGSQTGRLKWRDREVIFARFRVVEGPHEGVELVRHYNKPAGRLARTHELCRDFVALTGRMPPTKGFRLGSLLMERLIIGDVTTVNSVIERGKREPTPAELHYSKIARLIGYVVGPLRPLEGRNGPSETTTSTSTKTRT